jgi:hypothetical protein
MSAKREKSFVRGDFENVERAWRRFGGRDARAPSKTVRASSKSTLGN